MARFIARCRCTDRLRRHDGEAEFHAKLNGAEGVNDEEPEEPEHVAAMAEFKKSSRKRWGLKSVTGTPGHVQTADATLTPMERFKRASRGRHGGR